MSKYDIEIIKNPCKECGQDLDWLEEAEWLNYEEFRNGIETTS